MSPDSRATVINAVIAGAVAIAVAWITTGAKFEKELEAAKNDLIRITGEVAQIVATTKELQASVAEAGRATAKVTQLTATTTELQTQLGATTTALQKNLSDANRVTGEVAKLGATLGRLQADVGSASAELKSIRGDMPKGVLPSVGNCKPADQTPPPNTKTLCGPGFVMTGIDGSGRTSCCSLGLTK